MSLYPSLDISKSEVQPVAPVANPVQPVVSAVSYQLQPVTVNHVVPTAGGKSIYPSIEYMGLDLSRIELNAKHSASDNEIQAAIPALPIKGQVTNGLRQLVLCKDGSGKVGFLVSEVNKGIFVSFVLKGSPAALGGLRFGDQILQLNGTNVAGYSANMVHKMIKKCAVNDIQLFVRDRPFERTVMLHKDASGHVGFQFHNGKITKLVKDSSAARNGLVIDHNLLEVEGQNVIGINDKQIARIIENSGPVVTITIVPSFIFEQMVKKIQKDYLKASMDHTIPY